MNFTAALRRQPLGSLQPLKVEQICAVRESDINNDGGGGPPNDDGAAINCLNLLTQRPKAT